MSRSRSGFDVGLMNALRRGDVLTGDGAGNILRGWRAVLPGDWPIDVGQRGVWVEWRTS